MTHFYLENHEQFMPHPVGGSASAPRNLSPNFYSSLIQQPQNDCYFKNQASKQNWKRLLDQTYSLEDLESDIKEIATTPMEYFVEYFKPRVSGNNQTNKKKIDSLKRELFKSFLHKMNSTGIKMVLNNKERTGTQLLEDIHTLSFCCIEEIFSSKLLEIADVLPKDFNQAALEKELSDTRSTLSRIESVIDNISSELADTKKHNESLVNKIKELESNKRKTNVEDDNVIQHKKTKNFDKELRKKTMVIGCGQTEDDGLSAVSCPFSYYVGHWSLKADCELIKKFISKFARVLHVEELNTDISNRFFKSFKVSVESYSNREMLTASYWPAGIKVERWYEKQDKANEIVYLNQSNKSPDIVSSTKETENKL